MSRFVIKIGYFKYVDSDLWSSAPFIWDSFNKCFVELDGSVSKRFFETSPVEIKENDRIADFGYAVKHAILRLNKEHKNYDDELDGYIKD